MTSVLPPVLSDASRLPATAHAEVPRTLVEPAPKALSIIDHLGIGPFFATATKPEAAQPLGLQGTAELRAATSLTCVAVGGIGAANVDQVRASGVDGVAVVSAFRAADDPAAARLRSRSRSHS